MALVSPAPMCTVPLTAFPGSTIIHATTNETETAQAFVDRLPCTVSVSGTGLDFCGRMPLSLPYGQEQVHHGWTNGDMNYNPGGGWFAVPFNGEEDSMRYGDQVNMGRVDAGDLPRLHELDGSFQVRIELDDQERSFERTWSCSWGRPASRVTPPTWWRPLPREQTRWPCSPVRSPLPLATRHP